MSNEEVVMSIEARINTFRNDVTRLSFLTDFGQKAILQSRANLVEYLDRGGSPRTTRRVCSYETVSGNRFQVGVARATQHEILEYLEDSLNRVLCDSLVSLYELHEGFLAGLANDTGCSRAFGKNGQVYITDVLKYLRKTDSYAQFELRPAPENVIGHFAISSRQLQPRVMREVVSEIRHAIVHEYGTFDWFENRRVKVESAISSIKPNVEMKDVDSFASLFWRKRDDGNHLAIIDASQLNDPFQHGIARPYEHLFNVIVYYTHGAYSSILSGLDAKTRPYWQSNEHKPT